MANSRTKEEFDDWYWDAVNNVAKNGGKGKDADGNVVTGGNVEFYNCKNNLVSADNKLVILQDLDGYLVNDTDNVLVICKKDEDDDFKKFRNNVLLKYGEEFM